MQLKKLLILCALTLAALGAGCHNGIAPPRTLSDQEFVSPPASTTTGGNAPSYYYYSSAQVKLKEGQLSEAVWYLEKAIQYDPQSAFLKMELANYHLLQKNTDKALTLIQQVLATSPDHIDALILAGRIYQQQEALPKARALFEQALTQDPSDPNIYLYLGRIYWNEADYANAERVFRRMVTNFPDSYAAHYFSGKVLAAQGKLDLSAAAFNRSLELEPGLEEPRFELIAIYRSQRQPAKVIETYQRILENNPDNIKAAFELALEYKADGKVESAWPLLAELGQRIEDDGAIQVFVFENYLETKQYDTAAWIIEELLKGAPDSSDLHYLAGVAYDGLKQPQKALAHLSRVSNDSRFYTNAVVHSALLHRDMGNLEQSIGVIHKAMRDDPGKADYYLYLGTFYEELERYDEALAALTSGAAIDDKNARIHFRIGVVYDKTGKKQDAIAAMKQVLEINPEDVETLNYLGYTYADLGIQLEEAEVLIQNALKLKPEDGFIFDSMAWVYFKQGRYEDALQWLTKAVKLVPDDPVILEHLGDVYLKMENKDKALKYYRRSIEVKNKDHESLEEKIRALNHKP